ncbi:hypothetical protein LZ32DRAFT_529941 [Colletotrichum eremochloae]|nr:hypothetical protein LZ32DRAFT_529941 [Colletotrichum eremochloae]
MNPFQGIKQKQYLPVDGSDSEDDIILQRSVSSRLIHFMNLILYALFPILCIALFVLHSRLEAAHIDSGFLKGFDTVLDPIKGTLTSEIKTFTGGLYFTENDTLYREIIKGEPQYVGTPSPEIDAAWDRLLNGTFMNLDGPEASSMIGRTWKDHHGSYMVT